MSVPQSLREFYELMHSTVPVRRSMTADALAGRDPSREHVDELRTALTRLEALPIEPDGRPLDLDGGGRTHIDLDYEIGELQRDLLFAEDGEAALRGHLDETQDRLAEEVRDGVAALGGAPVRTLLTDRDGTVNNYCSRYASSVQSVYNATFLTRFAHSIDHPVVLTSAPLANVGLADLAVTPSGDLVLAGSKGREYLDRSGVHRRDVIDPAKQSRLDELNRRLATLLADPAYGAFELIGSGLQHKFGQTTIARQDIVGSVDPERSEAFAASIADLVSAVDPDGSTFLIEDTGLDLELILTVDDGAGDSPRDFDKGDGVRFLDRELGLGVAEGNCLVCGDTGSDVPMLTAAMEVAPDTRTVFVTEDDDLRGRVRDIAPDAVFVSRPDSLVLLLDELSRNN